MRLRYLIAGVPVAGILGGPFVANRTEPYVLGLPFILFWFVAWVVLTSVAMAAVYRLDPKNRPEPGDRSRGGGGGVRS